MNFFRRKPNPNPEGVPFPSDIDTIHIATEEAFKAALELSILQRQVWEELMFSLSEMGMRIALEPAIVNSMNSAIRQIQAASEIALSTYELEKK